MERNGFVDFRMAYLQYVTGELHASHAKAVEQSRVLLKDVRNLETDLLPRRRHRATLAARLQALEASPKPKDRDPATLTALHAELEELEQDLATFEASLAAVRRAKLAESARVRYAAQRELGEKLAIVGRWGELLVDALDGVEGAGEEYRYGGRERTAEVRAGVAEAIGGWSAERAYVPRPVLDRVASSGGLSRHDTRSFGSTHASQLSLVGDNPIQSSDCHSASVEPRSRTSSLTASTTVAAPRLPPHQPSPAPSASSAPSTNPFADHPTAPSASQTALHQESSSTLPTVLVEHDTVTGPASASGLSRMATTNRRRLEHTEPEVSVEGDALPTYTLMDEELSVEERERRQAEEEEARARENKQAVAVAEGGQ